MKKINVLMIAFAAIMISVGFVACNDDDDDSAASNWVKYQDAVTKNVKANK